METKKTLCVFQVTSFGCGCWFAGSLRFIFRLLLHVLISSKKSIRITICNYPGHLKNMCPCIYHIYKTYKSCRETIFT